MYIKSFIKFFESQKEAMGSEFITSQVIKTEYQKATEDIIKIFQNLKMLEDYGGTIDYGNESTKQVLFTYNLEHNRFIVSFIDVFKPIQSKYNKLTNEQIFELIKEYIIKPLGIVASRNLWIENNINELEIVISTLF